MALSSTMPCSTRDFDLALSVSTPNTGWNTSATRLAVPVMVPIIVLVKPMSFR